MELLHRRCCGLDVHKETVVACLRLVADGKLTTEVRTYQTITSDLLRMAEWLAANECTHVAMEATGVYWKPVWHILDDGEFALVLANAAHVKNVPGRKTDVNDAMWLAELLAHGLIRASFVPDTQTQEMRNLLRTRKQLVREQSSHVLRVQKTLEDANIKLDSVLSDLMGKSGRAMLEALIAGETNPTKLANLAHRRVKASPEEFREALRGRVTKHHRFLLRLHLNQIDALDAAMATIDTQVEANLGPFRTAVELLMSIPGIKSLGAHVIVSEIGIDMSRFLSAAHLISWAGICPRNDESRASRSRARNPGGTNSVGDAGESTGMEGFVTAGDRRVDRPWRRGAHRRSRQNPSASAHPKRFSTPSFTLNIAGRTGRRSSCRCRRRIPAACDDSRPRFRRYAASVRCSGAGRCGRAGQPWRPLRHRSGSDG